jgi:hypothetical protein
MSLLATVKGPSGFKAEIYRHRNALTGGMVYSMEWHHEEPLTLLVHSADEGWPNPDIRRMEDCDRACIECLFKHAAAYVQRTLSYEYLGGT